MEDVSTALPFVFPFPFMPPRLAGRGRACVLSTVLLYTLPMIGFNSGILVSGFHLIVMVTNTAQHRQGGCDQLSCISWCLSWSFFFLPYFSLEFAPRYQLSMQFVFLSLLVSVSE